MYYKGQPLTIQVIHKQGTTHAYLTNLPTALYLKCLTDKPILVELWHLTSAKL